MTGTSSSSPPASGAVVTLFPFAGTRRWTWSRCTLSVGTGGQRGRVGRSRGGDTHTHTRARAHTGGSRGRPAIPVTSSPSPQGPGAGRRHGSRQRPVLQRRRGRPHPPLAPARPRHGSLRRLRWVPVLGGDTGRGRGRHGPHPHPLIPGVPPRRPLPGCGVARPPTAAAPLRVCPCPGPPPPHPVPPAVTLPRGPQTPGCSAASWTATVTPSGVWPSTPPATGWPPAPPTAPSASGTPGARTAPASAPTTLRAVSRAGGRLLDLGDVPATPLSPSLFPPPRRTRRPHLRHLLGHPTGSRRGGFPDGRRGSLRRRGFSTRLDARGPTGRR